MLRISGHDHNSNQTAVIKRPQKHRDVIPIENRSAIDRFASAAKTQFTAPFSAAATKFNSGWSRDYSHHYRPHYHQHQYRNYQQRNLHLPLQPYQQPPSSATAAITKKPLLGLAPLPSRQLPSRPHPHTVFTSRGQLPAPTASGQQQRNYCYRSNYCHCSDRLLPGLASFARRLPIESSGLQKRSATALLPKPEYFRLPHEQLCVTRNSAIQQQQQQQKQQHQQQQKQQQLPKTELNWERDTPGTATATATAIATATATGITTANQITITRNRQLLEYDRSRPANPEPKESEQAVAQTAFISQFANWKPKTQLIACPGTISRVRVITWI